MTASEEERSDSPLSKSEDETYHCLNSDVILPYAIEAAELGVWSVDLRSLLVNWSEKCCSMLGLDRKKFIELHQGTFTVDVFLSYLHPDDRDRIGVHIQQAIAQREKFNAQFRMRHCDGEYKQIQSTGCATYENDIPMHMTGVMWEVEQAKGNEENVLQKIDFQGKLDNPPENNKTKASSKTNENALLSEREKEILVWAAAGKTSWETAMILGISDRTVAFHLNKVMEKLGVSNKTHAVAHVVANGLIDLN